MIENKGWIKWFGMSSCFHVDSYFGNKYTYAVPRHSLNNVDVVRITDYTNDDCIMIEFIGEGAKIIKELLSQSKENIPLLAAYFEKSKSKNGRAKFRHYHIVVFVKFDILYIIGI